MYGCMCSRVGIIVIIITVGHIFFIVQIQGWPLFTNSKTREGKEVLSMEYRM
jgi:hypothetical protein